MNYRIEFSETDLSNSKWKFLKDHLKAKKIKKHIKDCHL